MKFLRNNFHFIESVLFTHTYIIRNKKCQNLHESSFSGRITIFTKTKVYRGEKVKSERHRITKSSRMLLNVRPTNPYLRGYHVIDRICAHRYVRTLFRQFFFEQRQILSKPAQANKQNVLTFNF